MRSTAGASARSRISRDACCQSRKVSRRGGPATSRPSASVGAARGAAAALRNTRRLTRTPNATCHIPDLLLPRMVLPLDVLLHVSAVEPDVAQVAARVALCLVAEVLRFRITALASSGHGPGAHAIAELDDRHEAVAGGAVHLLRAAVGTRAERGQRSPAGGGERNR